MSIVYNFHPGWVVRVKNPDNPWLDADHEHRLVRLTGYSAHNGKPTYDGVWEPDNGATLYDIGEDEIATIDRTTIAAILAV